MAVVAVQHGEAAIARRKCYLVACLVFYLIAVLQFDSEVFRGEVVKESVALRCLGCGVDLFGDCFGSELWLGGGCHVVCFHVIKISDLIETARKKIVFLIYLFIYF